MKWKIRLFKAFSYTWMWLAFALVSLNLLAKGITSGWWTAATLISSSNWIILPTVLVILAPGLLAHRWARRLEEEFESQ